jgi:hypothetical protein
LSSASGGRRRGRTLDRDARRGARARADRRRRRRPDDRLPSSRPTRSIVAGDGGIPARVVAYDLASGFGSQALAPLGIAPALPASAAVAK